MQASTVTKKSSINHKAGLGVSNTSCHKKKKDSITQHSRDGSVALNAYIDYVMKWVIREAVKQTKASGKQMVMTKNIIKVLNEAPWLSSIIRNSEIRAYNGLVFDNEFDARFKEIYHTYNVSKHTRIRNKRKIHALQSDHLFQFDTRRKRVKTV